MVIEKETKGKIVEAIRKAGIKAKETQFTLDGGTLIVGIEGATIDFLFRFHPHQFEQVDYEFTPFRPTRGTRVKNKSGKYHDLEEVIKGIFNPWLRDDVHRFLKDRDALDPIEEFKKESTFSFGDLNGQEDEKLNREDKEKFVAGIESLRLLIKENYQLTEEKLEHIENNLKYLQAAPERLNKRDLKSLAQDLFINVGANLISDGIISMGTYILDFDMPELFKALLVKAFKMLFIGDTSTE